MAMPRVGVILARKKSLHKSARAAWASIGKATGIHPVSKFKLHRMDSATHYRWKFLGRK